MKILFLILVCFSMSGCAVFSEGMQGLGRGMQNGAQQTKQATQCMTQNFGYGYYNTYCN